VAAALRVRELDERLPWDHIDTLIPKSWLQEEWRRAMQGEYGQDCRCSRCNQCGVMEREHALCETMLRKARDGAAEVSSDAPLPERTEPLAAHACVSVSAAWARRVFYPTSNG